MSPIRPGTENTPNYRMYVLTRVLAHYRQGEYARVLERLQPFSPDPKGGALDAWTYLCLALAQHRLGQADAARQALAQARPPGAEVAALRPWRAVRRRLARVADRPNPPPRGRGPDRGQ